MSDKKNSVLIVDDEAINITALSHMIGSEYTVYVEKDGLGCIESARELKPDVILLDVVMPAMNGFEVIEELKKDSATRDIPIIFVTGLSDAQDEETGLLLGAADYISKPFSSAIVKLRVRNQLQIVNQMRLIHELSVTDVLTGVGNRRYFNDILSEEWLRALRQQTPLSFMILDIDHFKKYNDTYGHLQGDVILKGVAALIQGGLLRSGDKLARWGGEEFAVILPGTELAGACKVAEAILHETEKSVFMLDENTPTRVTVSAGVHTVVPDMDNTYTLDSFISDTDKALYTAKGTGRNRVCTVE